MDSLSKAQKDEYATVFAVLALYDGGVSDEHWNGWDDNPKGCFMVVVLSSWWSCRDDNDCASTLIFLCCWGVNVDTSTRTKAPVSIWFIVCFAEKKDNGVDHSTHHFGCENTVPFQYTQLQTHTVAPCHPSIHLHLLNYVYRPRLHRDKSRHSWRLLATRKLRPFTPSSLPTT